MSAQPFEETFAIVKRDAWQDACPTCAATADLTQSPWCACVTRERTPVCAACGQCRCNLPAAERRAFWLRAPQALQDRRREATRNLRTVSSKPHAPLVLLVDDDEEIRTIGVHVIEKLGYRCQTAASGPEALVLMTRHEPQLVITDALMPKMDGRELCRYVKKTCDAKVVIMTSIYTSPRYKYEALKTFGADAYLPKPVDFGVLQATLEKLIGSAEAMLQ